MNSKELIRAVLLGLALTVLAIGLWAERADAEDINILPATGESIETLPGGYELKSNAPIDKIIKDVTKDTVVLMLGDKAFCSGTVAKDTTGRISVYTAAHCCAVYDSFRAIGATRQALRQNSTKIELKKPTEDNYAPGVDACRLDTVKPIYSTGVKIAPLSVQERDLFAVSAFPRYSPSERIVRIFVLGIALEPSPMLTVSSKFNPGMSGSGVINSKGQLVGIVVAHYANTPYENGLITIMNSTPFLGKQVK